MTENLIRSANFLMLILNCHGGETNCKNNTRCSNTKGEQAQELVM